MGHVIAQNHFIQTDSHLLWHSETKMWFT